MLPLQEGGSTYTCDLCSSSMRTVRSYQVLMVRIIASAQRCKRVSLPLEACEMDGVFDKQMLRHFDDASTAFTQRNCLC